MCIYIYIYITIYISIYNIKVGEIITLSSYLPRLSMTSTNVTPDSFRFNNTSVSASYPENFTEKSSAWDF